MTNNYEILFIVPKNIDASQYSELSDKITTTIKDKFNSELSKFENGLKENWHIQLTTILMELTILLKLSVMLSVLTKLKKY